MTRTFSFTQVIAAVPRLTEEELTQYIEASVVVPTLTATTQVFCHVDLARLELLCDLRDVFNLDADAVQMVVGLIDQLHDARTSLEAITAAVSAEPEEVRRRIGIAVQHWSEGANRRDVTS